MQNEKGEDSSCRGSWQVSMTRTLCCASRDFGLKPRWHDNKTFGGPMEHVSRFNLILADQQDLLGPTMDMENSLFKKVIENTVHKKFLPLSKDKLICRPTYKLRHQLSERVRQARLRLRRIFNLLS